MLKRRIYFSAALSFVPLFLVSAAFPKIKAHETSHAVDTATHHVVSDDHVPKKAVRAVVSKNKTTSQNTASALKPSQVALSTTVSQNFTKWTHGKKQLSPADLAGQLKNSSIRGQDAAGLAAISARMNGLTTWDPHSLASINQKLAQNGLPIFKETTGYDHAVTMTTPYCTVTLNPIAHSHPQTYTTRITFTQKQLEAAIQAPNSPLYANYKAALSAIIKSTDPNGAFKLYGSRSVPPPLSDIRQWRDGDCYLVSSVGSLLINNPSALQKMITPVKGSKDEFTVNFPGYPKPIIVTLTKSEVGMYSHVLGGGAWLAVLSVAEASVRDPHDTNPMSIMHGGQQSQVLSLLTGKAYSNQALTGTTAQTTQLTNILTSAMNAAQPSSPTNLQQAVGIETAGHALLITGYNSTTGMVTIWNPWGDTGKYAPIPSKKPVFNMVNGQFSVPISQLSQDGFVKVDVPVGSG